MCKKKKFNTKKRILNPKLWTCVSNLVKFPYERWVNFSDIPDELFYDLWDTIEKSPNLILNEDATAFKKVKYVNFNRLNQEVFPHLPRL